MKSMSSEIQTLQRVEVLLSPDLQPGHVTVSFSLYYINIIYYCKNKVLFNNVASFYFNSIAINCKRVS